MRVLLSKEMIVKSPGRTANLRVTLALLVALLFSVAQADTPPKDWTYDSLRHRNETESAPANTEQTEDQQIAALLAKMVERWNAHDIPGYMECYWNSPDLLVVVEGEELLGWGNNLAAYQRGYPTPESMGTVQTERTLVRLISPDPASPSPSAKPTVAFAMDWWTVRFLTHSVHATTTYLLQKFPQEGWKVTASHTSCVEP
ncbi:MAG: hypothetical protein JO025_19010 [Verrucomicrobia bacterium]|nr:hypothetical protein [Verrucomicrobiota bacterium]